MSATAVDPCLSFVLVTPAEYGAFVASPFTLSAEDGALLSVAIFSVWAVAWGFRQLVRAVSVGDPDEPE